MLYDIRDETFRTVIEEAAQLSTVAEGFTVTEGLVWDRREQCLIFSDIPASTIWRWRPTGGLDLVRRPSNLTNGNTLDLQGRLLSCEHATSSISRVEENGRYVRLLANQFQGVEFNSPNDIICDSAGRLWFTDPPYGRTSPRVGVIRDLPQSIRGVYRLDPDGTLARVADDFDTPNGLCLLPGEQELLVNDTARMHIRRFTVAGDGSLSGGEILARISGEGEGKPDGMKVDIDGRIYCTGPGGVHVLTGDGDLLGVIRMPEHCRNFCFGGPEYRTMFFGCSSSILRLDVKAQGVPPPDDGAAHGDHPTATYSELAS